MPEFKMVAVDETPYIYAEGRASMDPDDISHNMEITFRTVGELVARKRIRSVQKALAVYYSHDETEMSFRAGFLVSAEDAAKAEGAVKAGMLPAGEVVNFIHKGPYSKLRDSYGEMMDWLEGNGMAVSAPTWEIYLKDPDSVASEDELETDVYVTVSNN